MGCSVTGVKPTSGDSPLQLGPKVEDVEKPVNPFVFLFTVPSWSLGWSLLCTSSCLHVAQGPDCAERSTNMRD
ncbi:putative 2-methyl-6-phytyl-1,4-hydroquinone methyltransferase [Helianthus annuus]|nr:putative 2-methyl-6-phytyl-1,4-hydroquinone methyltransferase [Helianthus annuus]